MVLSVHCASAFSFIYLSTLVAASDVKCYSYYEELCPHPRNLIGIKQTTSPSSWGLTFTRDNAMYDKKKCEWRTDKRGASFYFCCCNTNLSFLL
ncbi:unnamed protein product [Adineta ricciae]|uniref:Secreted protein n=1 Tax=Adineta ricciae TaxID=249248 RepID=A0A815N9C8_ADIRI|nr:unnamed protein product [Adineta ricciae]